MFIQTMPMEEERQKMGWHEKEKPSYVHCFYEEEAFCREKIEEADVVLFGGVSDESFIEKRLQEKKPVIRVDERMYKEAQWKAISPRGLLKKYKDHTRYKNDPVYFLCAGAYVADDLNIIKAYPGKKFCWGYFPPTKEYDVDHLMKEKKKEVPELMWAARMIDWKHPELAIYGAKYLKEQGIPFHLNMIGGGPLEEQVKALIKEAGLEEQVTLLGFQPPETVRAFMEQADIFLMTSDRKEGWGAVANEAMNSGCALLADVMTGAAPCLIKHKENGMIYKSGDRQMFAECLKELVLNGSLRDQMGRSAYETIVTTWNADYAAKELLHLIRTVVLKNRKVYSKEAIFAPCLPAPVISEKKMFQLITK